MGFPRHMTKRIKQISTTRKKRKPEQSAAFAEDYSQPTSLIARRIGEVNHQHRKLRNLTIAQRAAAADVSTAMLSRVERNRPLADITAATSNFSYPLDSIGTRPRVTNGPAHPCGEIKSARAMRTTIGPF